MFAAILAALANPAVDSAIVSAAQSLVAFFASLPEKDRQAAIAQVESAAASTDVQVSAFLAGSLADLASARAQLAALESHPLVQATGLAGTVATLKAELTERAGTL
jgi:hypothetical protein